MSFILPFGVSYLQAHLQMIAGLRYSDLLNSGGQAWMWVGWFSSQGMSKLSSLGFLSFIWLQFLLLLMFLIKKWKQTFSRIYALYLSSNIILLSLFHMGLGWTGNLFWRDQSLWSQRHCTQKISSSHYSRVRAQFWWVEMLMLTLLPLQFWVLCAWLRERVYSSLLWLSSLS